MSEFDPAWQRLEADAASAQQGQAVRSRLDGTGPAELHLGVSRKDGSRQLWVRLPDQWTGDATQFPRWRGCRVLLQTGSERPVPRTFVVLEQGSGSPNAIFDSLIAYVRQAYVRADPEDGVADVLLDALDLWRAFFEHEGSEGLGRDAQQGLYAELWFLREHILHRLNQEDATAAWTGGRRTNHDFQHQRHAIEVKSSSGRGHHSIRIKSERQLEIEGTDSLHVVFVGLARVDSGGETLPEMVASVRSRLADHARAARQFEEQLLAAGYAEAHAPTYRAGYAARDVRAYRVRAGFPRLIQADLPAGVADVSYSVSLDACEPYRVDLAAVLADFGGRTA